MSETLEKPLVRILHLEDSRVDHTLVKFALQRSGMPHELVLVDAMPDFQRELASGHFDLVLADYHLPGFSGLDAWDHVKSTGVDIPFVILSGAIGEAAAVEAMHRGVSDYLLKDSMPRLSHVIERALELGKVRRAKAQADAQLAESRQRLAELAEHLQSSIEQERADIAREIHDDIGGSLAAVKLDLSWVSRRAEDEAMRKHIDSAMEMLQHALGASQRIMMNLRPPILDQGLVAAVAWAVGTQLMRRTKIPHPTLALSFWMTFFTALWTTALAVIFEREAWAMPTPAVWSAIVYNALGVFAFAQVAWLMMARDLPPIASTLSVMFIPVLGVFSGAWWLGEVLHWQDWAAVGLVMVAIASVLLPKR